MDGSVSCNCSEVPIRACLVSTNINTILSTGILYWEHVSLFIQIVQNYIRYRCISVCANKSTTSIQIGISKPKFNVLEFITKQVELLNPRNRFLNSGSCDTSHNSSNKTNRCMS